MFEMPYNRITVQGGIGNWNRQKTIQDHEVYAYGGLPGAAYYLLGNYTQDQGFRGQNSDSQHLDYQAGFKLEPTVNGTLTGIFQNVDGKRGDTPISMIGVIVTTRPCASMTASIFMS